MNSIFSMRRFAALIKNDLLLNGKRNLLGALALLGGMLLFMIATFPKPSGVWMGDEYLLQYYSNETRWHSYIAFMFVIYVFVVLFASFSWLKEKNFRVSLMLIPASAFEKYLFQVANIVMWGIALFVILWLDAQLTRVYITWRYDLSESMLVNFAPYKMSTLFVGVPNQIHVKLSIVFASLCLVFYAMQANIWFRRLGWIKLIVLLVGLVYLYMVLLVSMTHLFFPEQVSGFEVHIPGVKLFPTSTIDVMEYYIVTMLGIGWLMLLAIGFFKFKETEV